MKVCGQQQKRKYYFRLYLYHSDTPVPQRQQGIFLAGGVGDELDGLIPVADPGEAGLADLIAGGSDELMLGICHHEPVDDGFLRMAGGDAAQGADTVYRQNRPICPVFAELFLGITAGGKAIAGIDLAAQQQHVKRGGIAQFHGDRQRICHNIQVFFAL